MTGQRAGAHPYIPNADPAMQAEMLRAIGAKSIDDFYADVPAALRDPGDSRKDADVDATPWEREDFSGAEDETKRRGRVPGRGTAPDPLQENGDVQGTHFTLLPPPERAGSGTIPCRSKTRCW